MRHARIAAAAFATLLAVPAAAQEGPIQGTIQKQMDAFVAGDVAEAFRYASPTIKGFFGSPANFGAMVQRGYPMVWKPAQIEYVDSARKGAIAFEKVVVRDGSGRAHVLMYQLIETPRGWEINGVQILDELGIGV